MERLEMDIAFQTAAPADPAGTLVVFAAKDAVLSRAAQALDTRLGGQLVRALKSSRFEGDVASLVEVLAP
ncbi:MAG TPA: hypothetical protein PK808_05780, partial [Polymorphobacter sp.]|nr:hypothetical protein [Polymorphobacter sp.]